MSDWNRPPSRDDDDGTTSWPPPPPTAPPPPGAYGQPVPPQPPGPYGQPVPPPPQYGTPGFGAFQPPAAPYRYGEGLPTTANLASPGRRIGGYLIDLVVIFVVLAVVWVPALVVMGGSSTTTTDAFGTTSADLSGGAIAAMIVAYGLTFLVPILYQIVFVALKGQTPGAMLVKVKVVRLSDGQTPGWGPAVMRWLPNLAGVLCSLITLALYIWALVNLFSNDLRQTPFDLAAKTVVIDVS